MSSLRYSACLTLLLSLAPACSDDDPQLAGLDAGNAQKESPPSAADDDDDCTRQELEPDLEYMPFAGPGVREDAIEPGAYLMATTYLRLRGDQNALFQQLVGPVIADISKRSGMIALATASSKQCGTARTLTVWRDEMAMLEFVVGDAHAKAMGSIHDLSRGGSVAAQWTGDQAAASWDAAAEHLATTDRPAY